MTRSTGMILIGAGAAICILSAVVLAGMMMSAGLQVGGAVLAFGIVFVVLVAPLSALGAVTMARSREEAQDKTEAESLRRVLDMVKTRGKVTLSDVVIEVGSDLPSVQKMVYRLVGMGVFSGYVNWDEGILYSEDAGSLHEMTQCKHCGGNLTLAGKGIVKCPFCGTEYFLSN